MGTRRARARVASLCSRRRRKRNKTLPSLAAHVRPDDVELAKLLAKKDALLARYTTSVHRWHVVQGAALAAIAAGLLTYLGGGLRPAGLAVLVLFSLAALAVGVRQSDVHDERFDTALADVLRAMERLKDGGA